MISTYNSGVDVYECKRNSKFWQKITTNDIFKLSITFLSVANSTILLVHLDFELLRQLVYHIKSYD